MQRGLWINGGPGDQSAVPSLAVSLPPNLAITIDPQGRPVVLTAERWEHILARHPELRPFRGDLLAAVRHPTQPPTWKAAR